MDVSNLSGNGRNFNKYNPIIWLISKREASHQTSHKLELNWLKMVDVDPAIAAIEGQNKVQSEQADDAEM